jgi:hypothetical protein
MRRARSLGAHKIRLARREGLSFPEPFFWTTNDLERLRALDPNYRRYLVVGASDVLTAPATKIRIVAEGDSWFNHPCRKDIMKWFKEWGYAPYRSDAPGRRLATMVDEKVYLKFLDDPEVRAVLLSGGGNDLISWKRASEREPSPIFKRGNGSSNPSDYFNEMELRLALAEVARLLVVFAGDVRRARPHLPIITHSYDHIKPRTTGPFGAWVGPQLTQIGVPEKNQPLRDAIAKILIERANDTYRETCAATGMTYVDVRGVVRDRWWDEIHPEDEAFRGIATKLAASVPKVARRRGRGPSARSNRRAGGARSRRTPVRGSAK